MQTCHCLAVPVEIRQDEKAFLAMLSVHDIFLLRATFYDVEDPVQSTFLTVSLHVWTNVFGEDRRGLGYHANTLRIIFLDVRLRARVDEVELEVWRLLCDGSSIGCA